MDDFDDVLNNWAAWARDRRTVPVSCKSFESRYRPPPMYHYPELKTDPDHKAAFIVEKELTSQTFPKKYMAILVYAYVYPWLNFNGALRKINRFHGSYCNRMNFDAMLKDARIILFNRLTRGQ